MAYWNGCALGFEQEVKPSKPWPATAGHLFPTMQREFPLWSPYGEQARAPELVRDELGRNAIAPGISALQASSAAHLHCAVVWRRKRLGRRVTLIQGSRIIRVNPLPDSWKREQFIG